MFKTLNELIDLITKLKDITFVVAKRNGDKTRYVYLDDSTKDHSSQSKYEYKGYKICFTDSVFDANFFIEKDAEDIRDFLKEENKDNNDTTWMVLGFSSLLDRFKISVEDKPKIIPAEDKETPPNTQDQPKEFAYYVGLLDRKTHIFRYVSLSTLDWDKEKSPLSSKIFDKLFENGVLTTSVTADNLKIFRQHELDKFMNSELISSLMINGNMMVCTFNTEIVNYSDLDSNKNQYYIYSLTDKNIIFFNGFLIGDGFYDLKLEDKIEKAKLYNRAETIINMDRLEEKSKNNVKWFIIKKNDPLLRDLLKKASECV